MTTSPLPNSLLGIPPSGDNLLGRSAVRQLESGSFGALFDSQLDFDRSPLNTQASERAGSKEIPAGNSGASSQAQAAEHPVVSAVAIRGAASSVSDSTRMMASIHMPAHFEAFAGSGIQMPAEDGAQERDPLISPLKPAGFPQGLEAEQSVVGFLEKNHLQVYMRDSRISDEDQQLIMQRLRSEFSWLGITLEALTINGKWALRGNR